MSPACRHTCSSQLAQIEREFAPLLRCSAVDAIAVTYPLPAAAAAVAGAGTSITISTSTFMAACWLSVVAYYTYAPWPVRQNACLVSRSLNTLTERVASSLSDLFQSGNLLDDLSFAKTVYSFIHSCIHSFSQLSSQAFIHKSAGNAAGQLV